MLTAACQKGSDSPGTSGTTGTASGVRVTQVSIGRSLNASKTINDSTDSFTPNDTVYASVATEGSAASAALKARICCYDAAPFTCLALSLSSVS